MELDLEELAEFLVRAKKNTYAGDGKPEERNGFKILRYKEGDWEYLDSYSGFYFAFGGEILRFKYVPVWGMSYSGGMKSELHGQLEFAEETFGFLKRALLFVGVDKPFRGPTKFREGNHLYKCKSRGDIKDFQGEEFILYNDVPVFSQRFIGGLVVPK